MLNSLAVSFLPQVIILLHMSLSRMIISCCQRRKPINISIWILIFSFSLFYSSKLFLIVSLISFSAILRHVTFSVLVVTIFTTNFLLFKNLYSVQKVDLSHKIRKKTLSLNTTKWLVFLKEIDYCYHTTRTEFLSLIQSNFLGKSYSHVVQCSEYQELSDYVVLPSVQSTWDNLWCSMSNLLS
jgi:hypothetical protein